MSATSCRYDRDTRTHLTREHRADCTTPSCPGCLPCTHHDGNPVRHCRARLRCTSHLGYDEHACPGCLAKIRTNLDGVLTDLALMPDEATRRGVNSEPANLAGPHADFVSAGWRLINAGTPGEQVANELDMTDPYTCLTMHERIIREALGHDALTLVSPDCTKAAQYLGWVLTDLARTEAHLPLLVELLGDTARLKAHTEAALQNSRTPERGIPCPACVEQKADAPRLLRRFGHWCERPDCEQIHYLDESGDTWRCPANPAHVWTEDEYRMVESRRADRRKAGADDRAVPTTRRDRITSA